jgi:hypothetical protein
MSTLLQFDDEISMKAGKALKRNANTELKKCRSDGNMAWQKAICH